MAIELKIPSAGESITEVTIAEWVKDVGSAAKLDETVAVIETDKANVDLVAPVAGTITKILKNAGDVAAVGEVVGYMEAGSGGGGSGADAKASSGSEGSSSSDGNGSSSGSEASGSEGSDAKTRSDSGSGGSSDSDAQASSGSDAQARSGSDAQARSGSDSDGSSGSDAEARSSSGSGSGPAAPRAAAGAVTTTIPSSASDAPVAPETSARAGSGEVQASPAVRRALRERGIDGASLKPNGGRVTMDDLVGDREKVQAPPQPGPRTEERVRMTRMRSRIAERLVGAQQEAALLTTFNEIDMTEVMSLRKQYQPQFVERHGIKLGFMSFFVKAAIEALKAFPAINAYIDGDEIVYHDYYDVGVAVGGGRGLVVPVIRDAERLSFAQVEKTIADFGQRAKANKLSIDELQGGTFTISNGGVYGSLMSTPIVNPPQSGILGMHAIQERPVARDGQVVVRPMMYVALTYDHRLVDGREAVTFLVKIKDLVENPTRLLLEV